MSERERERKRERKREMEGEREKGTPYRPISLTNLEAKIPNKILAANPTMYKNIIHFDQMGIVSALKDQFRNEDSISVINHINKLKKKNYIITSIDTEKYLRTPIHDKNSQQIKSQGKLP